MGFIAQSSKWYMLLHWLVISAFVQLLRPMYPGQLPTVKQNIFNIVLVADLSQSSTLNFLGGMVSNVIERGFGYRWGVVPSVETADGSHIFSPLFRSRESIFCPRNTYGKIDLLD